MSIFTTESGTSRPKMTKFIMTTCCYFGCIVEWVITYSEKIRVLTSGGHYKHPHASCFDHKHLKNSHQRKIVIATPCSKSPRVHSYNLIAGLVLTNHFAGSHSTKPFWFFFFTMASYAAVP